MRRHAERMEMDELRHSDLGVVSFLLSLAAGVALAVIVVIAGVMEATTPGGIDEESVEAIAAGLAMIAFLGLSLLAFCLGVCGLLQRRRKKLFAILGTAFSAVALLATTGLIVLGLAIDAAGP
jgi:hypothetical protein